MLNRSASLAMSTSVLKALPGKLDIKRHSPSILYLMGLSVVDHFYMHTGKTPFFHYHSFHIKPIKYLALRMRAANALV